MSYKACCIRSSIQEVDPLTPCICPVFFLISGFQTSKPSLCPLLWLMDGVLTTPLLSPSITPLHFFTRRDPSAKVVFENSAVRHQTLPYQIWALLNLQSFLSRTLWTDVKRFCLLCPVRHQVLSFKGKFIIVIFSPPKSV